MGCRTKAASWDNSRTGGKSPALLLGPPLPAQLGHRQGLGQQQLGSRGVPRPRKALPLSTGGASVPLAQSRSLRPAPGERPRELGLRDQVWATPQEDGAPGQTGRGQVPFLPQFPQTEQPCPTPSIHRAGGSEDARASWRKGLRGLQHPEHRGQVPTCPLPAACCPLHSMGAGGGAGPAGGWGPLPGLQLLLGRPFCPQHRPACLPQMESSA